MFIKTSQSGYGRDGEQFARGSFLLLFSHNEYKWEEQANKPHTELQGQVFDVAEGEGFTMQKICQCAGQTPYTYGPVPSYYLKYCPVHGAEYRHMPKELNRKLYACVRHVSLRQLGNFMVGSARIAGQSITVSGAYGNDGLPRDFESLTAAAREKLVEVPLDLTEQFWHGGGHNSAGDEAPAMRAWARAAIQTRLSPTIINRLPWAG